MGNNLIALLCFISLCMNVNTEIQAQDAKHALFAQLRKRYGAMNSLVVSFKGLEPISGISGTLKAMRSGKYVLSLNDRTIICDGQTLWNHHIPRKSVTINHMKSRPSSSLDIVLFNFLYNYQPKDIKDYTIGSTLYQGLELVPKNGSSIMGVQSLLIFVKKGSSEIRRIAATEGGQTLSWDIQSMAVNAKYTEATFTFIPPKDVEIIDLR